MIQAFIMVLREGFESFLIVAIILSYLKKLNQRWLYSAVYLAIAVSICVSLVLGLLFMRGVNQSLWEGFLGLLTIFLVGTLVLYMWRIGPRFSQDIEKRIREVSSRGSKGAIYGGLFLLSTFLITREGVETALMLLQVRDSGVITGMALGTVAVAFMAWVWLRFSSLINLKLFFQVTGIFLILFILQVAIYSFHEFSESGLLPHSETIHLATEPFSPVGLYGQWFSLFAIGACGLWLLGAWALQKNKVIKKSC